MGSMLDGIFQKGLLAFFFFLMKKQYKYLDSSSTFTSNKGRNQTLLHVIDGNAVDVESYVVGGGSRRRQTG